MTTVHAHVEMPRVVNDSRGMSGYLRISWSDAADTARAQWSHDIPVLVDQFPAQERALHAAGQLLPF